jgi:hypothetical protein
MNERRRMPTKLSRVRPGSVLAVAGATMLLTWLLSGCGGTQTVTKTVTATVTTASPVSPYGPTAVSQSDLKTIAGVLGQPVYWAGARPGYTYEFSREANGNIFLRYLPAGTKVGTKGAPAGTKGSYLSIATYPLPGAYAAIVRASKGKGSVAVKIPNGLAVYAKSRPGIYYFAYRGSKYQLEVLAASASVARSLVLGAQVVAVR